MAVTQARHVPSERNSNSGRGAAAAPSLRPGAPDEPQMLSTLRELVASGEHRLDPMLSAIANAAMLLTGATGVALAMWKEGAMVCRARSGETAPPLGAHLSADKGISGECLRTGKIQHCVDTEHDRLVDVEVCRSLGLRSIAALPVQGWRGVNGILEAFSTEPAAFSAHHLAVLEQLAGLAERARAARPAGASAVALSATAEPAPTAASAEKSEPAGLLPASDRFVDFAQAIVGRRPLVLGAVGLVTILLLGLVIWLGWRGNDGSESKARTSAPSSVLASGPPTGSPVPSSRSLADTQATDLPGTYQSRTDQSRSDQSSTAQTLTTQRGSTPRLPDNDPVWRASPGGQTLFVSNGKPSAARIVKSVPDFSASTNGAIATNVANNRKDGTALQNGATGADVAQSSKPGSGSGLNDAVHNSSATSSRVDQVASLEPPPLAVDPAPSSLKGVLSSKALVPSLTPQRISQGISGGQLIRRVPPVYPQQAKTLRMEGKVVLDAMVMEDGSVRDIKVAQGPQVFTAAAMEAVKQWRYKPFTLDGKPVKSPMQIVVDFKLPR